MSNKVYITTSIPYVNGDPHIGYTLEVVQADALARYFRLKNKDVFFLSGTDENAIKNVEAAQKQGKSTQDLVDQYAQSFLKLKEVFNLTYDGFIRTSEDRHKRGSQKFWQLCKKDLYKKKYEGLYCVGCETFYKEGQFPDNICPEHNRKLDLIQEENYFFAISKYRDQLKKYLESDEIQIFPEFRKNEVLSYLETDLDDFSVSRPIERTKKWGIPVPNDASQMIYVWFDALLNYITGLDFADEEELYKKYWITNPERYQFIGKNIIKFHLLYWPAMLMSAGIPLPKRMYVHGFMTLNGEKISKSLGNVIDPFEVAKEYGVEAVRYYLLREIPSANDGDFSYQRMDQLYTSELANELGNLISRITTLSETDGIIFEKTIEPQWNIISEHMNNFRYNVALEAIWGKIKELNRSINEFAPWKKSSEDRKEFLLSSLTEIHQVGLLIQPFMPNTALQILEATQGKVKKVTPMFPRKDKKI
ncbi:MAG: methionine--tRNA ligase [Candidatus Roizmanbacteria bacterium]